MSANQLFALASLLVFPAWLMLILLPSWKWTRVVAAYLTPALLGVAWAVLMTGRPAPRRVPWKS